MSSRKLIHSSQLLLVGALALLFVGSALAQNPTPQQQQGQAPGAAPGGAPRPPQVSFVGQPRIKALMVAGGCCHDYPAQAAIMMRMLQDELPVDWSFEYLNWRVNREAPAFYADPNWFRGYDIVVHNDCFTPPDSLVSAQYLSTLTAANRAGIPALVIHCAMHTFRDESGDEWRRVLGVHSMRHTPSHNIPVKVVASTHPVMAGIKADWVTPVDELYILERVMPGTTPLATGVDPATGTEYALAWVHQNGARVFGTSLGHGMDTWNDPVYQQLLKQGFKWAIGR